MLTEVATEADGVADGEDHDDEGESEHGSVNAHLEANDSSETDSHGGVATGHARVGDDVFETEFGIIRFDEKFRALGDESSGEGE